MLKINLTVFIWVICLGFSLSSGQAVESSKCYPAELIKADFQELYERMKASHMNLFAHVSESHLLSRKAQLEKQIPHCMDQDQAALLLQKWVSAGQVAHARIELPAQLYVQHRDQGGKVFPLSVVSEGTRLWVSKNFSNNPAVHTGDEIKSINGTPVSRLLTQLRDYLSADTDRMFGGFLEFYLEMLLWFEWGEQSEYALTVQRAQQILPIRVDALTVKDIEHNAQQLEKGLSLGWEREARMLDSGIAYLRPGPFFNPEGPADEVWDNRQFIAFIDTAMKQFKDQHARALVIDLRDNPGGDSSFSDRMVQWIADRPFKFYSSFQVKYSAAFKAANELRLANTAKAELAASDVALGYQNAYRNKPFGAVFNMDFPAVEPLPDGFESPVFVLVNRHSYSNAVTAAAQMQDYGFATIMGEETTDLASTYGAMEHFSLSHTGIKVGFPKARIIRPSGDPSVNGVKPDVVIETPSNEGVEDPVLKKAVQLIREQIQQE